VTDIFSEPLPKGLHLLDLPMPRPGFRRFIASWFFTDSLGRRVLVDPGPACSVPRLFEQLSPITDGIDFILLTHIHLDHSGGVGQVCRRYGDAKVLVHPRGAKHLVRPEKLWKASLGTLGDVAAMYGEPEPLEPEALLEPKAFWGPEASFSGVSGVTILETPGHAPHHLSFAVRRGEDTFFFVGEAAGFFLPLPEETPYLRPTTPPKFDGAAALASIRKIKDFLRGGELLCYSHWGASRRADERIAAAEKQIREWLGIISAMRERLAEDIVEYLLSNDSFLKGFALLPVDLRGRERFFIRNSVSGFLEFLRQKGDAAE
jgi:glyoxylase-like metal-dependent hydrolase (beta-lactamase superfamily II)